ncbi:MAG: cyclase family protein [Parachlamydiaceae bacterium]|nr:cyclase family protein [Parachlamydiaceae bacterium]
MNFFRESFSFVDLTQELSAKIPSWNSGCGFHSEVILNYTDCETECKFLEQRLEMVAGIGTHMDAPSHCIPNGDSIDKIPLEKLIVPCIVINISSKTTEKYIVSLLDVTNFENEHGEIPEGAFVIFYTGWDIFWNEPDRYRNHLQFPTISKKVAEYLLTKDIVGIGIDTLSPDGPESGYPVHQLILGAGKYIVENVANANKLPPIGSYSLVMPIKTLNGSEAPIRLVGLINLNKS